MHISYHPEAAQELVDAAKYYERAQVGLGARFLVAIEGAIQEIAAHPTRWRVLEASRRRYLVEGFPFAIIYGVEGEDLRILCIFHTSRDPSIWEERL